MKFELEINLSDPNQTDALHVLLCAIGGQETPTKPLSLEGQEEESEKPKKTTRKKETAKKAEPEEEEAEEENKPELNLAYVRRILGGKIQNGDSDTRDKCAAKLGEFGAKNVSTLDPEHYAAFVEYVDSL